MTAGVGACAALDFAVPFDVGSVPAARRELARLLAERAASSDDALLVLSELLTNALQHATPLPGRELRVHCALRGGRLELAVTDGGSPTWPHVVDPPLLARNGRGLGIVRDVTLDWGVRQRGDRTTVYGIVPVERPGGASDPT